MAMKYNMNLLRLTKGENMTKYHYLDSYVFSDWYLANLLMFKCSFSFPFLFFLLESPS